MISELESQEDFRRLFTIFNEIWGAETLSELISSLQNTKCALAKSDTNEVVGYVFYDQDERGFTEITDFGIDPNFRGLGYGADLIVFVCAISTEVRLSVKEDNMAARQLYEKIGFKEIQRIENYYGVGFDGLRMEWKKEV